MTINVDVPDATKGRWTVETFTVSKREAELEALRSIFSCRGRGVPEGTYKRLVCAGRGVIMSNTPDEIMDAMPFIHRAKGHVLINGLGLGVVVRALLDKEVVESITVIEVDQDVIDLVYPSLANDKRLTVICANALTWNPPKGARWNCVWHDIWDHITSDNLDEMHRLHRKYGRRCDYQESWCRYLCERNR